MTRRLLGLVLLLASGAALSCATLKKDQTVCPEFRNLRCVGRTVCDMDEQRGCRTCACEDATNLPEPDQAPENPSLPGG